MHRNKWFRLNNKSFLTFSLKTLNNGLERKENPLVRSLNLQFSIQTAQFVCCSVIGWKTSVNKISIFWRQCSCDFAFSHNKQAKNGFVIPRIGFITLSINRVHNIGSVKREHISLWERLHFKPCLCLSLITCELRWNISMK